MCRNGMLACIAAEFSAYCSEMRVLLMYISFIRKLALGSALLVSSVMPVFATCAPATSPESLQEFNNDPAAWLQANGSADDIGARVTALAAAAVNGKDANFGSKLSAMLGGASADQGRKMGNSLGSLVYSCTNPQDPANAADKQYISDNIAPNVRSNVAANAAYGLAGGAQTGAVGGGGGGSNGTGGISQLPSGGPNNGPGPNNPSPVPTPVPNVSIATPGGSTGATTSGNSGTTTSVIIFSVN
jgi:hypothetical protein